MSAFRDFFTARRWVSLVGFLTMVFGLLEARGTLTHLPEPWATVVAVIGGALAWMGRSGLADRKVPPQEPVE